MMGQPVEWFGLNELINQLRDLPEDMKDEATAIVLDHADYAKDDIEAAYPEVSGNLKRGLRVEHTDGGPFGVAVILKNVSPHAYIFENGTQTRQTALGANRGAMPPGNVFVPRVIRWRRAMYDTLARMMEAHGLEVRRAA
jgi:hypothetical protein